MISLFKKKPKLVDLIPNGYIDIHSHILPNIDDGSKSIQETSSLLEEMAKLGINKCIATPHTMTNVWDNSTSFIQETFLNTKSQLPLKLAQMLQRVSSEFLICLTSGINVHIWIISGWNQCTAAPFFSLS